jgi:hypothetical protein
VGYIEDAALKGRRYTDRVRGAYCIEDGAL